MPLTKITGGKLYDPTNGVDGEVRDLWIEGGRIVSPPADPTIHPARVINASGLAVMPGGVDIHCHIAGPAANAARIITPDQRRGEGNVLRRSDLTRSGTLGSVPSTFATGYKYAGLGYTTAFDAAIAPLGSRHAHLEFADTPCIDKGCFILMGNNQYALEAIEANDPARLRMFIAWLLGATKGYAPKLVNPGGVEVWKQSSTARGHGLDDPIPGYKITPRAVIREIVAAANDLGLPHPAHIHCNQLGMPGNWRTTLATMEAVESRRAHFAHIQFHSYGGGEGDEFSMSSRVADLADYVNAHPNLTVDVGQVMFGDAVAMTADGAAGYFLHKLYGNRWFNCDVEVEAGCGVTPIEYRRKSIVHALQWAIGLEWYLLVDDPWQVMMSTDHPNGGSFLAYPQIIRLLMDREFRRAAFARCPAAVRERCILGDLDREYTLSEIAVITRSGPARALGLKQKGHLGAGADADVTIYTPSENYQEMFELPRMVIKAGETIVDQGELRATPDGVALHNAPAFDQDRLPALESWFNDHYSLKIKNYALA
ncbi:formylmethanofuran dehydrogenase subunit A [Lacipirellula limnantheis]|uniref:Formyltransferase/hydrolase complex Fhc subunit A n=1 Tax=Lacipirellula limnantheis TaxID=2528024 RepID=A0A517U474_9BACT|nr:formylmethanofuran dehydrogenase subunit A [Lacipirellula limnantheis]QDT75417.1 Formyltransferase/hydrolase complex Fhc subunit A [Lacipirellula limnantheis]